MSNPAKSADEIEDVLASIRRLVSQSGAPAPRIVTPGKLVLTPAQRITEPDDPWAPVAPAAHVATDASPGAEEGGDPAWGLEDRLSDWGEIAGGAEKAVADAMAEQGTAPAPQAAGQDMVSDVFALGARDWIGGPVEGDAPEAFEPEIGDTDWPDQGADSALRDLAAVRITRATPDATQPEVAVPSDPTPPAEDAQRSPKPDEPAVAKVDVQSAAQHAVAEPAAAGPTGDAAPAPARSESDALPGQALQQLRRDRLTAPVFSRRTQPSADQAATAPDDGTAEAQDIEDFGDASSPFIFPDAEEGVFDEETLREIVAQVVREELQGALGQRITRNVRKMVRREIRIALAAEDLE